MTLLEAYKAQREKIHKLKETHRYQRLLIFVLIFINLITIPLMHKNNTSSNTVVTLEPIPEIEIKDTVSFEVLELPQLPVSLKTEK